MKTHVTHILQKLNVRDRVHAVVLADQTGLFPTDGGGRIPRRDEWFENGGENQFGDPVNATIPFGR